MVSTSSETCPGCGKDRVMSVYAAREIHHIPDWGGQTTMLEYADRVCDYCKAVKIKGNWTRMQTVRDRAYELSQASSTNKSKSDYMDILRTGDEEL